MSNASDVEEDAVPRRWLPRSRLAMAEPPAAIMKHLSSTLWGANVLHVHTYWMGRLLGPVRPLVPLGGHAAVVLFYVRVPFVVLVRGLRR